MKLIDHPAFKFDTFLPIYNWIYPLSGRSSDTYSGSFSREVFSNIGEAKSRALYLHIPFCETICTFCPFVRGADHDGEVLDAYVNALIREIELKGAIQSLSDVPIGAVYFGGGTPSLLSPAHIAAIGDALNSHFDLSACREFSFEFEVKSVTPERIAALEDIGVTHARFGAQTFSPDYRELFNLTASVDQLYSAASDLNSAFEHVSCDMLYGMHGQSEAEFFLDIERAVSLGISNLDFYPINNLVAQPKLHANYRNRGKSPTSGLTKFYMNRMLRAALHENGYLPHNGHGYVRADASELAKDPVVTDSYSFVYHEHVLGFPKHDLLGFGVNALSSFGGFTVSNTSSRSRYIAALSDNRLPITVSEHDRTIDACRPVSLALGYHGSIPKEWVEGESIPDEVHERLDRLVRHGLVSDRPTEYALTREGWAWYCNVIYYLQPEMERVTILRLLAGALSDARKDIETSGLLEYDPALLSDL